MRNKILVIALLITILSFSALSESVQLNLSKGKNFVVFNFTEPFYAETLIKLNPSIEAISYTENNKTIGYVNVFGGVGKNFIIQKNKKYEIIVKENSTLILPPMSGGK